MRKRFHACKEALAAVAMAFAKAAAAAVDGRIS
jgi:hypothetical protein